VNADTEVIFSTPQPSHSWPAKRVRFTPPSALQREVLFDNRGTYATLATDTPITIV